MFQGVKYDYTAELARAADWSEYNRKDKY